MHSKLIILISAVFSATFVSARGKTTDDYDVDNESTDYEYEYVAPVNASYITKAPVAVAPTYSSVMPYSTCYTTAYDYVCKTGICQQTHTITEYCPTACPTVRPQMPSGYTTTVTVCNHCGPKPTTLTLTVCPTILATATSTTKPAETHYTAAHNVTKSPVASSAPVVECYGGCEVDSTTTRTTKLTVTIKAAASSAPPAAVCPYGENCPPQVAPTNTTQLLKPTSKTPVANYTTTGMVMPTYTGGAETLGARGVVVAGVFVLGAFFL